MDKQALRKRYREERALMNPTAGDFSWTHILSLPEFANAKVVASYNSYGDEPRTDDLNKEILKSGKTLVLPKVLKDMSLEWIIWNGDNSALVKKGNFFEPNGEPINESEIDLVVIPSLHINRAGYRLGQGGGSYDRALANLRAFRIGLIYTGEITNEEMFVEPHDQKLDAAATPELVVRF